MTLTSNNAGHEHPISNPDSGYTDRVNGHRHKLSTGCKTCDKIRRVALVGRMATSYNSGHFHTFDPEELHNE